MKQPHDPAAFQPALGAHARLEPGAAQALAQAVLRLRREVAWLWRERTAQGLVTEADAQAGAGDAAALPPPAPPALGTLDLLRFADARTRFFADDVTARHLGERIAAAQQELAALAHGRQEAAGFTAAMRALRLSPCESFVLALALLPLVDASAGPVIGTCLNDLQRQEPTLALAQRLWDGPLDVLALRDPAHRLFATGLLLPAAGWQAPLQVPALVAPTLLLGAAAALPASLYAVRAPAHARRPAAGGAPRRVIPLVGPPAAAFEAPAALQAAARGLDLLAPVLPPAPADTAALMTLAWLRGHALLLPMASLLRTPDPHDPAHEHAAAAEMPLPALPLTLFVAVTDAGAIGRLGPDALPPVSVAPAGYAARLAAWQQALPTLAAHPVLAEAARRFRCELPQIGRMAAELRGRADIAPHEVLSAARQALDLGSLAQPVQPRFSLGELMLPPGPAAQLQEVVTAMRRLGRVHHEWGTARAWNDAGLTALFAGPPGTGKTMACEAIAQALDQPLVRIDLSQVVNKYIGETEKNLKKLFDAADASDTILFFDEADALFGKRTEVKDAHDRYANLEISYLLERMERFKGLAVLATNRRKDLDEAFLRRLRFVIEFPLPGAAERRRIWTSVLPEGVDASALDIDFLAQRFPLAGAHIRGIVFHACLQSAAEGAPRKLDMNTVVRAVQREFDKLERATSPEQFGPYAPLLAQTPALSKATA